jgi:uncharacterized membrane protein YfcA
MTIFGPSSREGQQFSGEKTRLASVVLPWLSIAVVASVAATHLSFSSAEGDAAQTRDLLEEHHDHHHKPVYVEDHPPLFPLQSSDYWGFFLAVAGLMVAAGGGIGGGGILVPIYILVMDFSPKHAIPLSNVTVLGGAVANTILNVRKRHPLSDRPMIDWDLILIMEPLTIAGALIGAFLNKVLPELLLTILLVVLLSVTAWKSLKQAVRMHQAETAAMKAATGLRADGTVESELTRIATKEEDSVSEEAVDTLLENMEQQEDDDNKGKEEGEEGGAEKEEDEVEQHKETQPLQKKSTKNVDPRMSREEAQLQEELEQILEEERVTPAANVSILVTMFVVVLAINLLKGGGAFPSPLGIKCGSSAFWMANAAMIGWILLISLFVRQYLVRRYERKLACGYQYVEGDIEWDARATIVYPCICAMAGFFAGMFGVGGGIVKGPLMLAMGVHPAVSSASSACMILFTSFTATTSFVVFGLLVPDYAVVCLFVGFAATFAGQVGLSYLMRKAQRNSYIAFSIGLVVLISALLMTVQSMLSMAEGEKHHAGGICGKGD